MFWCEKKTMFIYFNEKTIWSTDLSYLQNNDTQTKSHHTSYATVQLTSTTAQLITIPSPLVANIIIMISARDSIQQVENCFSKLCKSATFSEGNWMQYLHKIVLKFTNCLHWTSCTLSPAWFFFSESYSKLEKKRNVFVLHNTDVRVIWWMPYH